MPPPSLQTAQTLLDEGKLEQAEAAARRALAAAPADLNAISLLGAITFIRRNYAQSEYFTRRLFAHDPSPAVRANLGAALGAQGKHAEAVEHLRAALHAEPRDNAARITLASALLGLNLPSQAREVLEQGLSFSPAHPALTEALANALHCCGRVDEALPLISNLIAAGHRTPEILYRWAIMHTYASTPTPEQAAQAHRDHAQLLERVPAPRPQRRSLEGRRLRIGLMSQDFRAHSVASVIEPFVEHADRSRFEIVCYSTSPLEDAVTARLKTMADLWRPAATLSNPDLAAQISRDRIDILIDLAGLTEGRRLEVLALRPAPVQITYCGYPSTTGLTSVDFRIVDALTNPPDLPVHGTEQILRMQGCSTIYRPPDNPPPVSPLPALSRGHITFGAFGSLLKYNPRLLTLWARVLREVPSSRLILKHFSFTDEAVRADVVSRLEHAGAPAGSITALTPLKDPAAHLAAYHDIDISLDTFPYNGTVTILESLLMGVPVITLAGDTTASRMGLSLLTTAGHPDLVAVTEDQFITVAQDLATNLPRLTALRANRRQELLASPLCDGPSFAARLGNALTEAWSK
jgi:predicted O-linked N-acetylglucosamine transferase (SPINDLY family)